MSRTSHKDLIQGIGLSPEESFIIRALRRAFSSNPGDERDFSRGPDMDSEAVYHKAREWRIAPILFHALTVQKTLNNFSGVLKKLVKLTRNDYLQTSVINGGNYEKLSGILDAFRESGIRVILLKGIHLARFVYRDIGLRQMGDVDLLVKKEDLNRAEEILFDLGYRYSGPPGTKSGQGEADRDGLQPDSPDLYYELYKILHHHMRQFINPAGVRILEIHWTIINPHLPFKIDINGLWERAEKVKMDDLTVFVLSPEDLLLYLSMHTACSHEFRISGLRSCCDIAFILKHYSNEIDWNILKRRAHEWGAEKYLFLTLLLSKEILGINLPAGLLDSIRPQSFKERILLQAKKRVLQKDTETTPYIGKLAPDVSLGHKILFILKRTFLPSKKELASLYSISPTSRRLYLYYFVRLISLLYHKAPFYARLFLYSLTHKKSDFHTFNLDAWLIPADPDKPRD